MGADETKNVTVQPRVIASGAKQSPSRNVEIASSQSFDSLRSLRTAPRNDT